MSDTFIRHFLAAFGLLIVGLIYWAGYVSGGHGWWWAAIPLIAIYPIIFGIIKA